MRRLVVGGAVLILVLADACSPSATGKQAGGEPMDHLRCAAMISAADHLMTSGALPADPDFSKAALAAGMTHLIAYAIPKQMPEKDAFAAAEAERAKITAEMQPVQVMEAAKRCVETARP